MTVDSLIPYAGDLALATGWLYAALVGGKKAYHKALIEQLEGLVSAQAVELGLLRDQNTRQQMEIERTKDRIEYLEEIIANDPELVRTRVVSRQLRTARRSGPAHPPSGGNG